MRFLVSVAWALLPLLASAVPVHDVPFTTITTSYSVSPSSRPPQIDSGIASETEPRPTDLSHSTAHSSPSPVIADVVVPCQVCREDGADAFIPLHFEVHSPLEAVSCEPLQYTVNGHKATTSGHNETFKTQNITVDNKPLSLSVTWHCGLDKGLKLSTLRVLLQRLDGVLLVDQPAIWIDFSQLSTSGLELSGAPLNVHLPVTQGSYEVVAVAASSSLSFSRDDAIALLDQSRGIRERLRSEHPVTDQVDSDCRFTQFVKGIVESLPRLKDEAFAMFRSKMQAVLPSSMADPSEKIPIANVTRINGTLTTPPAPKTDLDQSNPLVRALEIFAGAVGLTALLAFIRRRFCSLRRRVERLADREERRTARAYRRAARREACARHWRNFKSIFAGLERNGDYEEKRALILEAAEADGCGEAAHNLMDDDDEHGLRTAQEIVTAMIESARDRLTRKSSESSYTMVNDAQDHRRRSDSLPSYESEELPVYSSQPSSERGASRRTRRLSFVSSRGSSAATPDSSIPELSPRCSRETLRTDSMKEWSEK